MSEATDPFDIAAFLDAWERADLPNRIEYVRPGGVHYHVLLASELRKLLTARDDYRDKLGAALRTLTAANGRVAELEAERAQLTTEWAVSHPRDGWSEDCRHDDFGDDEDRARTMARFTDGWYLERRLVGPWQSADGQHDPKPPVTDSIVSNDADKGLTC